MIATTADRVTDNTTIATNRRIAMETDARILLFQQNPDADAIHARLQQLDREWDIERCLETGASTLILIGTVLATLRRRWLLLPIGVAGFLLQHSIQGWCPPLPVLRRLGVRTADEIGRERQALRYLLVHSADASASPEPRNAELDGAAA
jgi:hypothetical protein